MQRGRSSPGVSKSQARDILKAGKGVHDQDEGGVRDFIPGSTSYIEKVVRESGAPLKLAAAPFVYWPYLTVEFKSEARAGNLYAAGNQNAISGA